MIEIYLDFCMYVEKITTQGDAENFDSLIGQHISDASEKLAAKGWVEDKSTTAYKKVMIHPDSQPAAIA